MAEVVEILFVEYAGCYLTQWGRALASMIDITRKEYSQTSGAVCIQVESLIAEPRMVTGWWIDSQLWDEQGPFY